MEDYEIRDVMNRRDVVLPLVSVDVDVRWGAVIDLVVRNIGEIPAEGVRFSLGRFPTREESGTREHGNQPVGRRLVSVALLKARDVPDEPGKNRTMNRVERGIALVEPQRAQVLERVVQLSIDILPLAHPQVGEEMLFAEFASLILCADLFPLIMHRVPNV